MMMRSAMAVCMVFVATACGVVKSKNSDAMAMTTLIENARLEGETVSAGSYDDLRRGGIVLSVDGYLKSGEAILANEDGVRALYIPEPTGMFGDRQLVVEADLTDSNGEPQTYRFFVIMPTLVKPGYYKAGYTFHAKQRSPFRVHQSYPDRTVETVFPATAADMDVQGKVKIKETGERFSGAAYVTFTHLPTGQATDVEVRINELSFDTEGSLARLN